MPPKKKKEPVKELPVIFTLKLEDKSQIMQPEVPDYSEILQIHDDKPVFNTELLRDILANNISDKYSEHTACFWCCHTFEWSACVLPMYFDTYKNLYVCEGNFCTPECALAWLYADKLSDNLKWNRHVLLYSMYSGLYSGEKELSPAPPRQLLRLFGGKLDINQYRQYIRGDNHLVACVMPPLCLVYPVMNVQSPLRDIRKQFNENESNDQLRLKRTKVTPQLSFFGTA